MYNSKTRLTVRSEIILLIYKLLAIEHERMINMPKAIKKIETYSMPMLPLRGIVVYPHMILHFDVGRSKSIKAIEKAMLEDQKIFLSAQKDPSVEDPNYDEIYEYGTISQIKQLLRMPGDTIRVLVEGIGRGKMVKLIDSEPFYNVKINEIKIRTLQNTATTNQALARQVIDHFEQYAKLSGKISSDATLSITNITDISRLPDIIASNIEISIQQKQDILEEDSPRKRFIMLLDILAKENEILNIEKKITTKVRKKLDKNQKEYYLREQIKIIQQELGNQGDEETDEYRERIENADLTLEAREKAFKELERLSRMHSSSAESGVVRTYLDTILDLPWNKKTEEKLDIGNATKILARDHYGLEKVKERVLEYLAVRKMKNGLRGPILCFVGPPGVGKTSIAKSIAEAINRKYVRMSLGGIRDEAEIRGHRRTYIGALPGRIISAIKQAGTSNPLILLDEIDKMSHDFKGDPASAMLEVLDGEQNKEFRDHYLELTYDLSDVMFITTANYKDVIPGPLLDRMEVIDISGYTEEEKINIASKYLVPHQLDLHGITNKVVRFNKYAIREIVVHYTREAGVRNLEREIATVIRKAIKQIVTENSTKGTVSITKTSIKNYLGARKYLYDKATEVNEIGIVRGLAWTPVGGTTMPIEVNIMSGDGQLELTGQLGHVMKESARIAKSYIRSMASEYGIEEDFYKNSDIHVHVPEGAIPKDGPSAGITLATATISALTKIPAKKNVAMTGEITLRGKVLPIGGLKEKVLAAHRAGIDTVLIPIDNKKDIEEIPENARKDINIIPVAHIDDVIKYALVSRPKPIKAKKIGTKGETLLIDHASAVEEAASTVEM